MINDQSGAPDRRARSEGIELIELIELIDVVADVALATRRRR